MLKRQRMTKNKNMRTNYIYTLILLMVSSIGFSQIIHEVNESSGAVITNEINDIDSIVFNAGNSSVEIVLTDGNSTVFPIGDVDSVTFSGQLIGEISSLSCGSVTVNGTLEPNEPASGVTVSVPYNGSNSGTYPTESVIGTGINGLTAERAAGTLDVGSGSVTYDIVGTPDDSGVVSFEITLGGQTCTFEVPVNLPPGSIGALDCGNATLNGVIVAGGNSNETVDVPYTGGIQGTHNGQTTNSIGVLGLTAELTPGIFNNGAGQLTYTITGTAASTGNALFALTIGGQSCTLSLPVTAPNGEITSLDCANATLNAPLEAGVPANNISADVDYGGGNGGTHGGQVVTSTGVTGLTAELNSGTFANGAGTLTYVITGTPSAAGTASFALDIGGETCIMELPVILPVGEISTLDCANATIFGMYDENASVTNGSFEVNYTGGNGGTHNGETVNSTGVTGLTAELAPDVFANGAGVLSYTVTGTPTDGGFAYFDLDIGGQTCQVTIYVFPVPVYCNGATTVVDVTNTVTGETWMDRNLGASQDATSSTDAAAYGDLYQWGRYADGHQCRNSSVSTTLASDVVPGHNEFIQPPGVPFDWISPQNDDLWQENTNYNNPCPTGYRIPTEVEMNAEIASWSSQDANGAFDSPLKLTLGGFRHGAFSTIDLEDDYGYYWVTDTNGNNARHIVFDQNGVEVETLNRAYGFSVRCIKE